MATDDYAMQYQGQIVSQSYNAGFAVLSCLVSFVGAASTLELINRRTGFRGCLLLVGSAVTMGGVTIWSMHFIANRAIELASGEPEMQISYSSGSTVLSFFVPVVALLAAFIAIGSDESVSWWRVSAGGIICGGAVCGMHYLGNASIANYHCVYNAANVGGSAVIAVAASTTGLSLFFVFRAMWADSWWKRLISAVTLAVAVCGMHWCAALGTRYRFISAQQGGSGQSRNTTTIVVICLSISSCLIIAGSAILRARSMAKSARNAQQITLAAAVFDRQGRILVDTNGLLPGAVITGSFLEKNCKDGFNTSHPLFHWMFQATRSWSSISSLVEDMKTHLNQLPHSGRDKNGRLGIDLINDLGEPIDDYDIIFRELFCVAASVLTERLRETLTSAGVLWDEILPTGANKQMPGPNTRESARCEKGDLHRGQQELGRGSSMFLVRRLENDRQASRLVSAGYRFAEIRQVSGLIASGMEIQSPDVESKLREMATYVDKPSEFHPGVGLGFFGIKARIGTSGFSVLVRKGARSLLPTTDLLPHKLEMWHLNFLKRLEGMSVPLILQALETPTAASMSPRELAFAQRLSSAIQSLRLIVQDPSFDEAVLLTTPVNLPYLDHAGIERTTELLTFRLLIPIHSIVSSPRCEFIPLDFFKVRQLSQKQQLEFVQGIYRELAPVVKSLSDRVVRIDEQEPRHWSRRWRSALSRLSWTKDAVVEVNDTSISTVPDKLASSRKSPWTVSTEDLCAAGSGGDMSSEFDESTAESAANRPAANGTPFSGILVSQEVTVDIEAMNESKEETYRHPNRLSTGTRNGAASGKAMVGPKVPSTRGIEMRPMRHVLTGMNLRPGPAYVVGVQHRDLSRVATFVDTLFAECVAGHTAG